MIPVDQEHKGDINERHEQTKVESDHEDKYWPAPIQPMRLQHAYGNDKLICFYTGLPNSTAFLIFCDNLGMQLNDLQYWRRPKTFPDGTKRGQPRKLMPHDKLLILMRLCLVLLEEDLAFQFGICQSLVSQIIYGCIAVFLKKQIESSCLKLLLRSIPTHKQFMMLLKCLSRSHLTFLARAQLGLATNVILHPRSYSGGSMFPSDLFTGSISDREPVVQSQVII